jgi:transposase-like protein
MPERQILTGIGPISIKQPRVDDRRLKSNEAKRFTSKILPRYMRRIPSINNLIPVLYLKGISTGDFPSALSAILGKNAKGLSPANIVRLKKQWEEEYREWGKQDLSHKTYIYFWADGIYFNVRLDDERQCILVIMGVLENGKKEIVAVNDGYRESTLGWCEMLLDLKVRG